MNIMCQCCKLRWAATHVTTPAGVQLYYCYRCASNYYGQLSKLAYESEQRRARGGVQ